MRCGKRSRSRCRRRRRRRHSSNCSTQKGGQADVADVEDSCRPSRRHGADYNFMVGGDVCMNKL